MKTTMTNKIFTLVLLLSVTGCDKDIINNDLDTRQRRISSLADCQALLDNTSVFGLAPSLQEVSSDDCYVIDSTFGAFNSNSFNAYTWQQDVFQGRGGIGDWEIPYTQIFYSNLVLESLPGINDGP